MWRGIASKSLLYDISTNWMYDIKLLLDEPIYLLCMQNIFSLFLVIVMDALPCWVKQLIFSSFTCSIHHLLPLRCSLPQNELPPICTYFVFFSFFGMKLLTSVTLLLAILLFFCNILQVSDNYFGNKAWCKKYSISWFWASINKLRWCCFSSHLLASGKC